MVRTCSNRRGGDRQTVRTGGGEREEEKKKFTFKFLRDAGEKSRWMGRETRGGVGTRPPSLGGISRSRFEARLC